MYTPNVDKLPRLYYGVQESQNNNSFSTDKYIKVKAKVESCGTDSEDVDASVNIETDYDPKKVVLSALVCPYLGHKMADTFSGCQTPLFRLKKNTNEV